MNEIVFFFSDSQVVTKGLECEEGETENVTPATLRPALPVFSNSSHNAPKPCRHNPPFG